MPNGRGDLEGPAQGLEAFLDTEEPEPPRACAAHHLVNDKPGPIVLEQAVERQCRDPNTGTDQAADRPAQREKGPDRCGPGERVRKAHIAAYERGPHERLYRSLHAYTGRNHDEGHITCRIVMARFLLLRTRCA